MKFKLGLSQKKIALAKKLAHNIVQPVQDYIKEHTTVTVERASLRVLGADGVNSDDVPVPNLAVRAIKDRIDHGASRYYINALLQKNFTIDELNHAIAKGLDIATIALTDFQQIEEKADQLITAFSRRVADNVSYRKHQLQQHGDKANSPMLYLIVATGNIHEDVKQATAAAEQGADAIAVIRSTAQSLLDYVPFGATTEGFGGTYATQENFHIMRAALDEAGHRVERYIHLVNYCSGLCMPEIAVMGALERLDMMLNDSMYGVLFRDINMYRTFVDQHFSRMINAFADIIINTGEDNYLTTCDAFQNAYTVLASQFINERFAVAAGLPLSKIGLGHAFEIDPEISNGFLYELAQAQMAREIFPECPLKYMPPTKYMTGDIFQGHLMDAMFNFASKATNQSIHLLGMLTEGIHTPFMQDRYLAIKNARYVMNSIEGFYDEIEFKKDGIIINRAKEVLDQAVSFLEEVNRKGLFEAIEQGRFADVFRPKEGGKGLDGVVAKADRYWNPVQTFLSKQLGLK